MLDVGVEKQLGHTHFDFAFSSPALKTVVFGPSGCGKTTLLKILAGLSTPDRGNFCFNTQPIIDMDQGVDVPAHRRNFGYLPQKSCLFPHMNVAQNIHYGLRYKRVKHAQEMVHQTLAIGHPGDIAYARQKLQDALDQVVHTQSFAGQYINVEEQHLLQQAETALRHDYQTMEQNDISDLTDRIKDED